jgi:beta-1,4-mannosyl-glycoprotein beta-1,4-N-acetylglucosaminyltransferase
MLQYRLRILSEIVDYFVIVESKHSFVGKEKEIYFHKNKELFDEYSDKIIYILVDDFPYQYPNINISKGEQWKNEAFQRDCIKRGIDKIQFNDEDIILVSDLDEIPDPVTLTKIKNKEIAIECNTLRMDNYYYNLNLKHKAKWDFPKIISYKFYKTISTCDTIRRIGYAVGIDNGGWHLSYFGDKYFIQNKIRNFSHQELNNEKNTDEEYIQKYLNNAKNDRNFTPIIKNTYLPPLYDIYLRNFIIE